MCCYKNLCILEVSVRVTQEKKYPQYFDLNFSPLKSDIINKISLYEVILVLKMPYFKLFIFIFTSVKWGGILKLHINCVAKHTEFLKTSKYKASETWKAMNILEHYMIDLFS